jgi:hypothetical protein
MLLTDSHLVHIHTLYEPSLALLKLHVIAAHMPLPHSPILSECPILKPVTSLPLQTVLLILILIPELDRNLVCREGE